MGRRRDGPPARCARGAGLHTLPAFRPTGHRLRQRLLEPGLSCSPSPRMPSPYSTTVSVLMSVTPQQCHSTPVPNDALCRQSPAGSPVTAELSWKALIDCLVSSMADPGSRWTPFRQDGDGG